MSADLDMADRHGHRAPDRAIEEKANQMIDITAPLIVEVQIRSDEKVLWVNIDGICRLRCCRIAALVVIR